MIEINGEKNNNKKKPKKIKQSQTKRNVINFSRWIHNYMNQRQEENEKYYITSQI